MTLDTHQHFWHYDPARHAWIDDAMNVIQRNFTPEDLKPELDEHDLQGCIAVQVDQNDLENQYLLALADQYPFIKGVVGWVDLRDPAIDERLEKLTEYSKLCGFRHIVQGEQDVNFLLRPDVLRGIYALKPHEYTYDILVYPHQLGAVLEFVRRVPDQRLVIDHMAKPYIKDRYMDGWEILMKEIAAYPHVYCKVSGLITEANWSGWTYDDIAPYLDVVFNAFGIDRLMYGSDWPVCLVAGSYADVYGLVDRYTDGFSTEDKAKLFGLNGQRFYAV